MGDALIMLHFKFEPAIPFWFEDIDIFVSNFVKISRTACVLVRFLYCQYGKNLLFFKLQIFT